MNRLPAPYGDCVNEGKTADYIFQDKDYTTEGCQRSCIQKHLVMKCGCGDPRFPTYRNFTNCPVADAARSEDCICKQPCKQEVYSVSYSCARWPSGPEAGTARECGPNLSPAECLKFHREEAALIEVYFEQLNYESLMEERGLRTAQPALRLRRSIGCGLWMGVSVITIMEVAILVTEMVLGFVSTALCPCLKSKEPSPEEENVHLGRSRSGRRPHVHALHHCKCNEANGVDYIRNIT
ncbi:Degenerin-like protein asic-1 [Aphelenchoides fujianensis]|nr:Degenerin-like protein asic-1 [Aphelenchoides fujianensis]